VAVGAERGEKMSYQRIRQANELRMRSRRTVAFTIELIRIAKEEVRRSAGAVAKSKSLITPRDNGREDYRAGRPGKKNGRIVRADR